jgi:hypothetical protein
MYLLYINEQGKDYKGQRQYQFIFGDNKDFEFTMDWLKIPSSGQAEPPNIENITYVGTLKDTDIVLELVQNSDYFGLVDAVDNIIALGWEPLGNLDDDYVKRLCFHYGDTIKKVENILCERKLKLIIEEIS